MKHYLTNLNSDSRNSIVLVLFLTGIILIIRKTDMLIDPQFWAEDGSVFFLDQYKNGASIVFQGYAGYLHLVPRLIALVADLFPYSLAPAIYSYSSFIITIIVVASVFSPRFQVNDKPLIALTITLIPHYGNEVFVNLTNVHWILAIMLIIVLFKEIPSAKYGNIVFQYAVDLTIIIVCGLTGPFIVFLLPFFIWKTIQKRNIYNYFILTTVVVISLIQLSYIISIPSDSQQIVLNWDIYSQIIGHKLIGNLFIGHKIPYNINHLLLSFFSVSATVALLYYAYHQQNRLILFAIGISIIIILATLYKFQNALEVLIVPYLGQRYFYIPYVMIVWSLITLFKNRTICKMALLTIVLISSLTSNFHSQPLVDYDWNSYSKLIGKKDIVIPINPPGWTLEVKKHY